MSRKGMSLTIEIIIIVVVILVSALVILTIFSGGINNAFQVIMQWIGLAKNPTGLACDGSCKAACDTGESQDIFKVCDGGLKCCIASDVGPPA